VEHKRRVASYVAEDLAREMLAKDAKLKAEFDRKLTEDKAFASDPHARLDFFYRRSRYWDERMGLYPVYRVDAAP